jgi:ankyrin repeat protein
LFWCCIRGDVDGVRRFVASFGSEAVVGAKASNKMMGLHCAIKFRRVEVIALLIEGGADVNAKNDGGRTGLHFAALNGWVEVVALLLEGRADVNAKTNNGSSPIAFAAYKDHSQIVRLLVNAGADVDNPPGGALSWAIQNSSMKAARELFKARASLAKAIEFGNQDYTKNCPSHFLKNLEQLLIETCK